MSVKYHVNPETGNANICRASLGNCPFEEVFAEHYESKLEAQKSYESQMENPVSDGAWLVLKRNKTQTLIAETFKRFEESGSEESKQMFDYLVLKRNRIDSAIKSEKFDDSFALTKTRASSTVSLSSLPIVREGNNILGFHNTVESFKQEHSVVWDDLVSASESWIRNCSSYEAKAIYEYANDSGSYAISSSLGGEDVKVLHEALKKSPKFSSPVSVFSGLSFQTRDIVLSQSPNVGSKIVLNRALSTSVNPAQVNGFMSRNPDVDWDAQKNVAVEIETDNGGVMVAASRSVDEFEILLPPAEYEVVEISENVKFLWGEDELGKRVGLTADMFIKLRKLKDL